MMLVDSSVWVNLLSKRPSFVLTEEMLPTMAVCPPVLQEILQGIGDDLRASKIRRSLESFWVFDDPVAASRYLEAADIYRTARRKGFTVRSSVDCLIAAIALHHGIEVWHDDRDFEVIARFTSLRSIRGMR